MTPDDPSLALEFIERPQDGALGRLEAAHQFRKRGNAVTRLKRAAELFQLKQCLFEFWGGTAPACRFRHRSDRGRRHSPMSFHTLSHSIMTQVTEVMS
jgi:hypothetical protein